MKLAKERDAETDTLVNIEAVAEDAVAIEQMTIGDGDKANEDSQVGALDGQELHHGDDMQHGEDMQDDVFEQSALEGSKHRRGTSASVPLLDYNPIGLGTIDGSYGLFVKLFGVRGYLAVNDL